MTALSQTAFSEN